MSTSDFITKVVNHQQTKEKTVASVFFDGKHLYSYGYHYPLLMDIKGKWILNDAGYSATTAKHISYARQHADYTVNLRPDTNNMYNTPFNERIKNSLDHEITELTKDLKTLSTRAFRQKQIKTERLAELNKTLDYINSL